MKEAAVAELCTRLRQEVKAGRDALKEIYERDGDAEAVLQQRCQQVDSALTQLWKAIGFPNALCLAAVGGYGRGELYPASDIDLLILLPGEPDASLQAKLENLIGHFWDIGLEIGHSVRTIEECLKEAVGDITVRTALLEARHLAGSKKLFGEFAKRFRDDLDPVDFFRAKSLEQDERYIKYNETPYALEPNCKEAPGGLRDIQVIFWVAQAAGLGKTWKELEAKGILTPEETVFAQSCERYLQHLRIRLHLYCNRREDRLLFDIQNPLAAQFGFVANEAKRPSEQLMQGYYRNAKGVCWINTVLLQNISAVLSPEDQQAEPIDANFQKVGKLLDIRRDDLFETTPSCILDCFLVMQEMANLKGMTTRTLRKLWQARYRITPEFRADPENRALFLKLFRSSRGIIHEFRRMNQLDILGVYLPAFGKIVGQMQHDLFHVYTVDQHILQVLRNLRRFTMEEFAHEYPLCSRLASDFDRYWLLYVAAIFHDIAKGRGGDHSALGMADARAFCEEHGLSEEETELVEWLVGAHLVMSQVAQKEDITDPDVVSAFAKRVKDVRHLTALYLLTHADIRGTSPKVWNNWKGKLLADLFFHTQHILSQEGAAPPVQGVIAERQAEAMRLLRYFALSETVHERLWKQLDTVYFLRHSAEEIAWHTRALHYRIFNDTPVVKARQNPDGDGLQVMVYTKDQPDLFLRVVGFFSRAGYNIADAKIHTTQHGYALDSFVLFDVSQRDNDREMISFIEYELNERLLHQTPPEIPPAGRLSRQVKHFPIKPEITIHPDEKGSHHILSVLAADRPGLLYTVAAAIARHGANLHTAKISTLGERVEDTFLISGGDLNQSTNRIKLETELLEMLNIAT